jgi:urease accessory protein
MPSDMGLLLTQQTRATEVAAPSWLAELELGFALRGNKTALSRCRHQGPLGVQRAFYPEQDGSAHVYLLHPPAGIVSGDELRISANLEVGSRALLTTPGANRFYRARGHSDASDRQSQFCTFHIKAKAVLEYLPLETLVYNQANAVNQVEIKLEDSACYMGWEVVCLGLPHIQQPFKQGKLQQVTTVYHNLKPLFHDRMVLSALDSMHQQRIALGGHHVVGNFIICAGSLLNQPKKLALLVAQLRTYLSDKQLEQQFAVTEIQGVVVIRHLGESSEHCRETFHQLWGCARQFVLNKMQNAPRIWYT